MTDIEVSIWSASLTLGLLLIIWVLRCRNIVKIRNGSKMFWVCFFIIFALLIDTLPVATQPSPVLYPDLILEKGSIYPYPPVANTPTIIQAAIRNVGKNSIDNHFITTLYVDNILSKTWEYPSEAEKAENVEPKPIKPDGSRLYSYDVNWQDPGDHFFRWVVDANNEIFESDERNNALEYTEKWHSSSDLPDLVIGDIYNEGPLLVGKDTIWKIKIKNVGTQPVAQSFITVLKSEGVQFASFECSSLNIGEETIFESTQHCYYEETETITGIVDVGNTVNEKDESNNAKSKPFKTTTLDIEVSNLAIKPDVPLVHNPVTFSFTVKNKGQDDAGPFKVWIFPGVVNEGATQPILLEIPSLKGGASTDLEHTVQLQYATKYPVNVLANYPDPAYAFKEKTLDNNFQYGEFDLKESYFIKFNIDYNLKPPCKGTGWINLDRSGGYWKGNVKIKLGDTNQFITIPAGKSVSEEFSGPQEVKAKAYAVVGNQLIESSAPEQIFHFTHTKVCYDSCIDSSRKCCYFHHGHSCPSDEFCCGDTCCKAGWTCSNGQCKCSNAICGVVCCGQGEICKPIGDGGGGLGFGCGKPPKEQDPKWLCEQSSSPGIKCEWINGNNGECECMPDF